MPLCTDFAPYIIQVTGENSQDLILYLKDRFINIIIPTIYKTDNNVENKQTKRKL